MGAAEEQQTQRQAGKSGEQKPACACPMDLLPVLRDHNGRDGDGEQHCQRDSGLQRNAEGQQRNRDQSLAKTKGRTNQRRDEDDRENAQREKIDGRLRELSAKRREWICR